MIDIEDADLRQLVEEELEFEPSIDAADIGVAVEEGVVTLTGHVPTYAQKRTAERVVAGVKGVRGIAQEIEVRPAGSNPTADDEIAKRALNTLKWNTSIPQDAVKVSVSKGWVTLRGEVEWYYQREKAEQILRDLSGVTGVSNNLVIKPKVSVTDVRERIEKALKRTAELEASSIRVVVADGTVTLDGKVHSLAERNAAERAAWAAPGVRNVQDHLHVA